MTRLTDRLDRFDKKHPAIAKIAAILIAFACLYVADQMDHEYTASIRWEMAADRGAT